MSIRITTLAAASALALGLAACTPAEQDQAEVNAEVAADNTAEAMKAAQAVESGAGKMADKLEANQAEAAAEGRPGAAAHAPTY